MDGERTKSEDPRNENKESKKYLSPSNVSLKCSIPLKEFEKPSSLKEPKKKRNYASAITKKIKKSFISNHKSILIKTKYNFRRNNIGGIVIDHGKNEKKKLKRIKSLKKKKKKLHRSRKKASLSAREIIKRSNMGLKIQTNVAKNIFKRKSNKGGSGNVRKKASSTNMKPRLKPRLKPLKVMKPLRVHRSKKKRARARSKRLNLTNFSLDNCILTNVREQKPVVFKYHVKEGDRLPRSVQFCKKTKISPGKMKVWAKYEMEYDELQNLFIFYDDIPYDKNFIYYYLVNGQKRHWDEKRQKVRLKEVDGRGNPIYCNVIRIQRTSQKRNRSNSLQKKRTFDKKRREFSKQRVYWNPRKAKVPFYPRVLEGSHWKEEIINTSNHTILKHLNFSLKQGLEDFDLTGVSLNPSRKYRVMYPPSSINFFSVKNDVEER